MAGSPPWAPGLPPTHATCAEQDESPLIDIVVYDGMDGMERWVRRKCRATPPLAGKPG